MSEKAGDSSRKSSFINLRCPSCSSESDGSVRALGTGEASTLVRLLSQIQEDLSRPDAVDPSEVKRELQALLDAPSSDVRLSSLRDLVLSQGLPDLGTDSETRTLRARVWKALLGVSISPAEEEQYNTKANDETAVFDSKIKNDAFRTFKGNEQFWAIVSEEQIVRVLRAVSRDAGYVQGMNVLLGPFLMTMGELDAYACFRELVVHRIPSYVTKDLEGVHRAIALASRCLPILDPQLYNHIQSKLYTMTVFSVKYVLTLMANTQPLDEVLKIWDAVFAFGTHFSFFVFLAFLIAMRKEILAARNANLIMRVIENGVLNSELLVRLALELIKLLPADLLEEARSVQLLLSSSSSKA